MSTLIEMLGQRLAELRQIRTGLTAGIATTDTELAAADTAVGDAQQIYDTVVLGKAVPPLPNPYDKWREDPEKDRQIRDRIERARGMFEQADRELGDALVRRTTTSQRRGLLLLRLRRVDEDIPAVERELKLARQAPAEDRDFLGSLRARIFGQPAGPA